MPSQRMGMVVAFLGLPKVVTDPAGWLKDKLVDLYNSLGGYVQNWVLNPPRPTPGAWLDYLYGNSLGLAVYLVSAVAVMVIFLMVVSSQHSPKVLKSGVTAALIAAIYPLWFSAGNWFSDAGSQMIQAVAAHPGTANQQLLILPQIHNVIGAIFGLFALLVLGGGLLVIFFIWELLLIVATILGLPLLALSPLGEGFRRKFEQMIVLVLVTSFFGRLAAVGILSLGTQFVANVPLASSTLGTVLTLIATLALACYSQWWLLRKADRIYGNITGRTLGTARVSGMVETIRRPPRREADMASIQAAHTRALTPQPIASPSMLRIGSSGYSSSTLGFSSSGTTSNQAVSRWAAFRRRRSG